MKALTNARALSKLFKSTLLLNSERVLARDVVVAEAPILLQCRSHSTLFSRSSALLTGKSLDVRNFSADASTTPKPRAVINSTRSTRIKEGNFTEEAKEIYDKLFESAIVERSRAPKSWTRSLIQKCQNQDDIKLLFNMLEKLREFRLSNLGIYENFDLNFCRDVTKACVRAKAIGYGMKTMSKHNVYGLTPTTGTVNELMRYARKHNDTELMVKIMQRIKKNGLVLQPITADLVFSICYDTDNWGLLKKYSGQFISAKVKLRPKALQVWTDFAAKKGDDKTLERIKELRAAATKKKSSSKLKTE